MTFDDPQVPNPLEPAEDPNQKGDSGTPPDIDIWSLNNPGSEPEQPAPNSTPYDDAAPPTEGVEKKVTGSLKRGTGALNPRTKVRDDYVSELRQVLASQEDPREQKSGGLIRRLTGTLRRVTGPLRGTGALSKEQPEEDHAQEQVPPPVLPGPEITDRAMSGRLMSELPTFADEPLPEGEDVFNAPLPEDAPDQADFAFEDFDAEVQLFRDQPLELSEMEDTSASGEALTVEDSDWVSEIRQEAAASVDAGEFVDVPPSADEQPPAAAPEAGQEAAGPRKSGGLLSMITGILGRRRKADEKDEISDALVTGRLQRSLGAEPEQPAEQESTSLDDLYAQDPAAPLRGAAALGEDYVDDLEPTGSGEPPPPADEALPDVPLFAPDEFSLQPGEEDVAFYSDPLASRLGGLTGEPGADAFSPEITPEDEALIWGDAAPADETPAEELTFNIDDLWDESGTLEGPEDRRGQGLSADELYAAQFLTGDLVLPGQPGGGSQDNLLREALDQQPAEEEAGAGDPAMADLRAIALEDYDQAAVDRLAPVQGHVEAPIPAFDDVYMDELGRKPRRARPALTRGQKLLRALVVVLSVLTLAVVAFTVYMLNRPPVYQVGYIVPRPLPANLPYPIGMVLPGGWQFMLDKSTFVEGQWRPDGGEWLEGTELRRVVALPWNPQTEAVIRTFQPGDTIWLALSNDDMVDYTVTEVTRIPADDTSILAEKNPSLVIILYQEDAPERWVVFSKP